MVSVGVWKLGCTEIHFIKPGVKVNDAYHDNFLAWISQGGCFVFQQDVAKAHRALDTVAFLVLNFIPPTLWPPNSPDLNPVDYSICNVLQEKVCWSTSENALTSWSWMLLSTSGVCRLSACVHVSRACLKHIHTSNIFSTLCTYNMLNHHANTAVMTTLHASPSPSPSPLGRQWNTAVIEMILDKFDISSFSASFIMLWWALSFSKSLSFPLLPPAPLH